VTDTVFSTAVNTFQKRDNSVPLPTWLPKTLAANLVSSACSCYVTPPPAKTAEKTITSGTKVVTVANTAAATQIVTVPIYCHVAGVLNVPDFLSSGEGYTVQQCKALCLSDSRCNTFIFDDDGTGACTTISETIAGNYDPGSSVIDFQFNYDRNCDV
jgi:hypothetical protein